MKLAIGIDTGGTYTDAVLLDVDSGQVRCKAKALTTPHDLALGIAAAIDRLGAADCRQARLVSISTTLATNAIVEGRGGRVALLLAGYDEEIMQRSGLANRLPVEAMCYVAGGHDVKGDEVCPLDIESARRAIFDFRDRVDAFAVSGYFGVMNPEHELRLRDAVGELTAAPVVCGHELTSKLNALKRVSTVVLNARLLPMIRHLLDSVKTVLANKGIAAPLMVVKGDGSLIGETVARQRPVETILSGPAASAIGAEFLAGERHAIVVDMGGTTTDMAILEDGRPWNNPAGATVGGWQTCVQAADLRTIGLGGDSHIRVDKGKILRIGPCRAIPLCRLGAEWPQVIAELERASYASLDGTGIQATDFATLACSPEGWRLGAAEARVVDLLRQGPALLFHLHRTLSGHLVPVERLEAMGLVRRAGLTPTDILWSEVAGIGGDGEAARAGAEAVARRLDISVEKLAKQVLERVATAVAKEILDKLVSDRTGQGLFPAPLAWDSLLAWLLGSEAGAVLGGALQVRDPIVAIGAPVGSFMPLVADKLHTRCIIPPHAEVGNAVGAVVAGITHTVEILVQPHVQGAGTLTYLIHSPRGREVAASLDEAVARAEAIAVEMAVEAAQKAGAGAISVKVDRQYVEMGVLSEVTVRACASGRPGVDGA